MANGGEGRVQELGEAGVVEAHDGDAGEGDPGAFPVQVLVVEELGSDAFLYGNLVDELSHLMISDHLVVRLAPRSVPAKDTTAWFRIQEGTHHAFDPVSGLALPTD